MCVAVVVTHDRWRTGSMVAPRPNSSPDPDPSLSPSLSRTLTLTLARWRHGTANEVMQGFAGGRTSSTLNSPMEVVHLAVGLPDMVAKVARETRAVAGTMRAAGLSARVAAAENIIVRR